MYALILKHTKFHGEPVPFVMELPNYRLPSARSVGQLIWEKARDFVQRAFTIIFVATVIIWFLQTFDARLNVAASADSSLLALVGSWIAPVFAPLGFADWRVSTALITGFYGQGERGFHPYGAAGRQCGRAAHDVYAFYGSGISGLYPAVYPLCSCHRRRPREMGSAKAAAGVVIAQCVIAWVIAFLVHCIGMLIGLA